MIVGDIVRFDEYNDGTTDKFEIVAVSQELVKVLCLSAPLGWLSPSGGRYEPWIKVGEVSDWMMADNFKLLVESARS